MAISDLWEDELMRLRIMLIGMIAVLLLLAGAIWRIQVSQGKSYQRDLMKQSIRRVRIPGMRGVITDCQGVRLADNRPSYCVAIFLEELRQPGRWPRTINAVEKQLDELAQIMGVPRQITREDIQNHIRKRLPLPLLAWKDIGESAMARLAERTSLTPGFDVYTEAVRVYPQSNSACHVLGYVGRAELGKDEDEEEDPYHYYLPEMEGRAGLEKKLDSILKGEAGGKLLRVDVSGFSHDDMGLRPPVNGRNVQLSLDLRIQKAAVDGGGGRRGAFVVVDPNIGVVLALASAPGFNPNDFIPFISSREWKSMLEDPSKPLFNRAAVGAFPPGSIFKPVVAMAALENHKAAASISFNCPGYFELGRARFKCWFTPGHGVVNMQQAIKYSCNVFFYHLGLLTGPEAIAHMARALGLGRRTEISLDVESAGLVPDDAWKRRAHQDGWREGDTCNYSIGQGFLAVTPLQMAMLTAALANGGTLYRPRLVLRVMSPDGAAAREIPPCVANDLRWDPANIGVVRNGMLDVVHGERGTGRLAQIPQALVAGKTGTAEVGKKNEGKKLGWMIAFAPFEKPRYAVVVMVEDALSGGTTAAPIMKIILTSLFGSAAAGGKGAG